MTNFSQAELASIMEGGADKAQLISSMLGDRASNPLVQMLLTQMMDSSDATDANSESDAFDDIEDGDFEELPDPQVLQRRQRLKLRIQEWREELFALRRHNDELAGALGACCQCWGYDNECPECDGAGRPGWEQPNSGDFQEIVEPAVRRYLTSAREAARSADQAHHVQEETQ